MGHISIVYGIIIGDAWRAEDRHRLFQLNKHVIDALPDDDNSFPWITRNMFNVPDPVKHKMYRDQVITFGSHTKLWRMNGRIGWRNSKIS